MFVEKVLNEKGLTKALQKFFATGKEKVLVEECLAGVELTCGLFGNETIISMPPSKVVAQKEILSITEKFLPGAGENQTPAPLPKEDLDFIKKEMEHAYRAIGCKGYARIDCFYQDANTSPTNKKRVVVLEINSLPALTPATCLFHQAAEIGMRPVDFLEKVIELGLELHQSKKIFVHSQKEGVVLQ
jgi:UDP-N-acetylmuramate--alanine ligase